MESQVLLNSFYYTWIVIPLLIFLARVVDVTIETVRNIFIIKGFKYIVALIGFIEVLVWLLALQQIMKNLNNPACFIAYAAGVSTGNFIGIWITEKLSLGLVEIKLITQKDPSDLMDELSQTRCRLSRLEAEGAQGSHTILFSVMPRRSMESALKRIKAFDPRAFYTVEDIQTTGHRWPAASKTESKHQAVLAPFRWEKAAPAFSEETV